MSGKCLTRSTLTLTKGKKNERNVISVAGCPASFKETIEAKDKKR